MISRILIKVLACTGGTALVFGLATHLIVHRNDIQIDPVGGEIEFTNAEKQMIQEAIEDHRLSEEALEVVGARIRSVIDHPARLELALNNTFWADDFEKREKELIGTVIGAILGLLWGVGWAISHNAARWHFLGWTLAGGGILAAVLGVIEYFTPPHWDSSAAPAWLIIVPLVGIGVGIVTALESAGVFARFKDKKRNRLV